MNGGCLLFMHGAIVLPPLPVLPPWQLVSEQAVFLLLPQHLPDNQGAHHYAGCSHDEVYARKIEGCLLTGKISKCMVQDQRAKDCSNAHQPG